MTLCRLTCEFIPFIVMHVHNVLEEGLTLNMVDPFINWVGGQALAKF